MLTGEDKKCNVLELLYNGEKQYNFAKGSPLSFLQADEYLSAIIYGVELKSAIITSESNEGVANPKIGHTIVNKNYQEDIKKAAKRIVNFKKKCYREFKQNVDLLLNDNLSKWLVASNQDSAVDIKK